MQASSKQASVASARNGRKQYLIEKNVGERKAMLEGRGVDWSGSGGGKRAAPG